MKFKRRHFFSLSTSSLLACLTNPFLLNAVTKKEFPLFFSAGTDKEGKYFFSGFNVYGKENFRTPLMTRGHGVAQRTNFHEVAAFARRPGKYILVVNALSGERVAQIESIGGRHFFGHGIYSKDGRWLFATESEYDSGRGVLGVYDAADGYRLVDTLPTHGVGPHEVDLLADGKTLVVANGGILTHPDSGRMKLNLDVMDSSLAYIEMNSGKQLEAQRLDPNLQLMSIRHLAVGPDDNVAVVMQYQGSRRHLLPLVGFQKGSGSIDMLSAPETVGYRMKNYCGSVTFDLSGKLIGVSSPRGGIITFWSVAKKRFLSHLEVKDGCGVAAENTPESFRITNGFGQILRHFPLINKTEILTTVSDTLWDNHLLLACG